MSTQLPAYRLSIAPMMARTDRHFRYFMRLISKQALLYTEMITTGALIHGDRERYLQYDDSEHPIALQLGGSNPSELKQCAIMVADTGYDEVNLNVGCPSDRVQSNQFGACLMTEPGLVADCIDAMQTAVNIPVTVKCRTGVDDHDRYEDLYRFIDTVSQANCDTFIIHARKAWLTGLSPKENREIPPLNYATVHQIKQDFPHLTIIINGGFLNLDQVAEQLNHVDGVMIGREAYQNPYLLAQADQRIFASEATTKTRFEIMQQLMHYIEKQLSAGCKLSHITRHVLGLYQHQTGARLFRRYLAENSYREEADIAVLNTALECVEADWQAART